MDGILSSIGWWLSVGSGVPLTAHTQLSRTRPRTEESTLQLSPVDAQTRSSGLTKSKHFWRQGSRLIVGLYFVKQSMLTKSSGEFIRVWRGINLKKNP